MSWNQFTPIFQLLSLHWSWFSNPDRTIRSDQVNREPSIITVLLVLRTSLREKSMKPLKPRLDRMVLRTVAGFQGSLGSLKKKVNGIVPEYIPYLGRKIDIARWRIWIKKLREIKKKKKQRATFYIVNNFHLNELILSQHVVGRLKQPTVVAPFFFLCVSHPLLCFFFFSFLCVVNSNCNVCPFNALFFVLCVIS